MLIGLLEFGHGSCDCMFSNIEACNGSGWVPVGCILVDAEALTAWRIVGFADISAF